jgi:hypothetical protein
MRRAFAESHNLEIIEESAPAAAPAAHASPARDKSFFARLLNKKASPEDVVESVLSEEEVLNFSALRKYESQAIITARSDAMMLARGLVPTPCESISQEEAKKVCAGGRVEIKRRSILHALKSAGDISREEMGSVAEKAAAEFEIQYAKDYQF